MKTILMTPIGFVRSTRKQIEDDLWDAEKVHIELDPEQFSGDVLEGLTDFSHVEILFYMNKVDPLKVEKTARHPRNNTDWPKVGIFSQRGKNRPNQIGLTICKLTRVEDKTLYVEGLDAIDGTPVLDIKPWVNEFAPRGAIQQPSWITELMTGYWSNSFSKKNDEFIFGQLHYVEYYVNDLYNSNTFWNWFMPFMGYVEYQKWDGGISWRHSTGTYIVFVQVETEFLNVKNNRQGNGVNHIAMQGKDQEHFNKLQDELNKRQIKILIQRENYICFEDPNDFAVEVYLP